MPGLFGNLNLAAKALQAQQVAIQVTGRNIANVNNPEYSRQRVLMGDRFTIVTPTGPEGSGVEVLGVQQLRDTLLDRQVIRQVGETASLNAQQHALSSAELALGDRVDSSTNPTQLTDTSNSTTGIGGAIDDFFNNVEQLAASPGENPKKDALIQSGQILADRINNADNRLAMLQSDLENQIKADTDKANALIQDIARLNGQIRDSDSGNSGGAADLIDRRQADLEELSKVLKFEMSVPSDAPNQINVAIGGFTVVNYSLTPMGPNPVVYVSTTPHTDGVYPQKSVIDAAVAAGTGAVGRITISGVNVTSSVTSGSIQGGYSALTDSVTSLRTRLQTLATQIAASVNGAYNNGAASSAWTRTFFQTTPASGLIQVDSGLTASNLVTGLGDAGDNSIVRKMGDLRTQALADLGGARIGDYVRTTATTLGQNLKTVNTRVDEASVIEKSIRAQRDSVSGVSLDEETTNLMQYQRAYQANAKVISVLDSMLDSLINSMVR